MMIVFCFCFLCVVFFWGGGFVVVVVVLGGYWFFVFWLWLLLLCAFHVRADTVLFCNGMNKVFWILSMCDLNSVYTTWRHFSNHTFNVFIQFSAEFIRRGRLQKKKKKLVLKRCKTQQGRVLGHSIYFIYIDIRRERFQKIKRYFKKLIIIRWWLFRVFSVVI